MDLNDLSDLLQLGDRHTDRLKELLRSLTACQIEWNVLGKDQVAEWTVCNFLAGATITNGKVYYSYYKGLKDKLFNPKMYARINLSLQNKFQSRYALALYELFIDYYDVKRSAGETPWIDIPIYRKLMGLADTEYKVFADLKKRTITLPIEEINNMPGVDLFIEIEYKGFRPVEAVKFKIHSRSGSMLPQLKEPDLFANGMKENLIAFGVHETSVEKIVRDFDHDLIKKWMECIVRGYCKNVENQAGFLVKALTEDYALPPKFLSDLAARQKREKDEYERVLKLNKNQKDLIKAQEIEAKNYLELAEHTDQDQVVRQAIEMFRLKEPEHYDRLNKMAVKPLEEFGYKDFLKTKDSLRWVLQEYVFQML
jgi:hypothetical protein